MTPRRYHGPYPAIMPALVNVDPGMSSDANVKVGCSVSGVATQLIVVNMPSTEMTAIGGIQKYCMRSSFYANGELG